MINNIYYYYFKKISKINFTQYLLIYSLINIQKPKKIFLYHNNIISGKFYDKLKNKKLWSEFNTEILFINISEKKFKNKITEDLNNYGGIYIKKDILILRNIDNFLIHDNIKLDDILIGLSENNNFDEIEELEEENIFQLDKKLFYCTNDDNLFRNIIFDYNFSEYFNIIYNHYILDLSRLNDYELIYDYLIKSKITIFNLIIYYCLGYDYYFNNKLLINSDNIYKINKIDKIFYINLDRNKDRNINMKETLNKLNIEYHRYEGLDGKKYNNIKNDKFIDKDNIICNSNYEYAVLYSHLSLIKKLENEEGEYFLILEDDLCLDFINYWNNSIENIIINAPNDWEIIMLGYFTLDLKFKSNYRKWNNDWSALSYIIKKSSINKINNYIYNNKFDLFNDVNVADNYIFRIFNTYLFKYPLFTISNNNKSTFHNDHDNYQKIYKNINYLILNNTIDIYL